MIIVCRVGKRLSCGVGVTSHQEESSWTCFYFSKVSCELYISPSILNLMRIWSAAVSCCDSSLQLNSTLGWQQQRPQQTVIQWGEPVLGGGCCWVRGDHDTLLAEYTVHCWLLPQTHSVTKTHSLSEHSDPAFAIVLCYKCGVTLRPETSTNCKKILQRRWVRRVNPTLSEDETEWEGSGIKQDRKVSSNIFLSWTDERLISLLFLTPNPELLAKAFYPAFLCGLRSRMQFTLLGRHDNRSGVYPPPVSIVVSDCTRWCEDDLCELKAVLCQVWSLLTQ